VLGVRGYTHEKTADGKRSGGDNPDTEGKLQWTRNEPAETRVDDVVAGVVRDFGGASAASDRAMDAG